MALAFALAGAPVSASRAPDVGAVKEIAAPASSRGGRFVLAWAEPKKARNRKWAAILLESGILQENVASLNAKFALPFDIPVAVEDCGEANAYYVSEERRIRFCYELLGDSTRRIRSHVSPQREAPTIALGDMLHTLYHEVGHALIDALNLPTVGREEDAVDQFATLVLLASGAEGAVAAQVAALEYKLGARESRPDFADEHSTDRQRAYEILCLVYGKDARRFASLVGRGSLPQARAETCGEEYRHLSGAWDRLLAPFLRD